MPQAKVVARELDRAAIAENLQKLRAVLESYELIPSMLIKHLQGMLAGHVENFLVDTLVQQVSSYDYDNALATTEKIAAALDIAPKESMSLSMATEPSS